MKKLKELRKFFDIKQIEIAEIIGVPRSTYAKWEQSKSEPCIEDLKKLARFWGFPIDFLVNEENEEGIWEILTSDEHELINCFRGLDKENKHRVLGYCYGRVN